MTMKNFRVRKGLTIAGETTASTSIAAPNSGSDQSYTLPTAVPAVNGYVLASQTDGTMSWVANPDTNTTYDFNATTATGGANLNLVGSDATTDTVKLSNGGHITATYTSGTEVTLGSDATDANTANAIVARDASGNFSSSGATLGAVTVGVDTDQIVSTSSGNLTLQTAAGVNAGTLVLTAGANGAITLAPNGTGSVVNTFSNGGNLSSNRSSITGAIRSGTGATAGNYTWALNGALGTQPFRGFSADNSGDTTANAGVILRNYSSANAGSRSRVVFERARGTAASPTAVQAGDFIGSIEVTGCNAAGVFINDALQTGATTTTIPGFVSFVAAETWNAGSGSGPIFGTTFAVTLAPTATAITSGSSLVPVMTANPQTFASRSDAFTWANGKTGTTQTMALDVSGNLIVTGDVRVNGNDIQGSGGTTAISLTSANTATTVRGDIINLVNAGNTATNLQLGSTFANFASAGTNYAAMNSTSTTFTNSGLNTFIRTGTVNTVQPALTLRYQRTDTTGPNDGDGVDFRLGTGGTVTNTNIARFDATYKTSGLHQFGISVSTDSFAADSDNIYRGQADKTVIRATPAGTTGTAQDVVTVEQAKTTISTTPSTSVTATARLTVEGTAITASAPIQFPAYMAVAVNGLLASTGASGTGSVATLTFGVLPFGIPYSVGSTITVAGVSPAAYNGDVIVTACTTSSVSYVSTATGAQTVVGTIKLKAGELGQQIAITDSFIGGRMAYWDTTNNRWSYIIDDSAV